MKESPIFTNCRYSYGYGQEILQGKRRSQSHLYTDFGFGLSDRFVFCNNLIQTVKFYHHDCGVNLHCLIINNLSSSLSVVLFLVKQFVFTYLVYIVNKLNLYFVVYYFCGYRYTLEYHKRHVKYSIQPLYY